MTQTQSGREFRDASSPRYADVFTRLSALEDELTDAARGTGLPADPQLTQLVTQSLARDFPLADIQIVVSSSRKTTTTKHTYETETPGMVGLDTNKLRELQKQLMEKISLPGFDAKSAPKTNGSEARNGVHYKNGGEDPLQHTSTVEEVSANADGSQVTSKKLTRIVTTSHSAISGLDKNCNSNGRSNNDEPQLRLLYPQSAQQQQYDYYRQQQSQQYPPLYQQQKRQQYFDEEKRQQIYSQNGNETQTVPIRRVA